MDKTRDLLVEIGTEELPPKALNALSKNFAQELSQRIESSGLTYTDLKSYGSPRRLGVWVQDLAISQLDRVVERRGPALAVAFTKEGQPTAAAQGFAHSCGVLVDALDRIENDKGIWLVYRQRQEGVLTQELLPAILAQAIQALLIPKRMRWSNLQAEFIRPVHWLILLFGDEIIPATLLGVQADRKTWGHRFHCLAPLYLSKPADYVSLLETQGKVLVDFSVRRETINTQVMAAAQSLGGKALIDEALLDEVTGLVEWPVTLAGEFDKAFLTLPTEALIATMQSHQKYFPVQDEQGRLMPYFITVCNIESENPATVVAGNERVIRPRLTDAAFFYATDCKTPLIGYNDRLKRITFQEKLGSIFDKTTRIAQLARYIARDIGGNENWAERAGFLSKCDLATAMVAEFPELQGVMGRYYALHSHEPAEVAEALREQYLPRFAGDILPRTATGQALSLADRLDTLIGLFGIGQAPSGDKDPYGLRRAALGVLRIMIESKLALDLLHLLTLSCENYGHHLLEKNIVAQHVYDYLLERLRSYYLEAGFRVDEIEAVLVLRPRQPWDFDRRLKAVSAFLTLPEATSLAAANKRIQNILRKHEEAIPAQIQPELLQAPAEQSLADKVYTLEQEIALLLETGDYGAALKILAGLRDPIDRFFDEVMVRVEDLALRANRLALLTRVQTLFLQVADISRLQI
ncbi:glycyl-tRNA synthetase subunit beta [Candidatus Nitrosoglobus terrae]|uniref:Glycine--tRNA ligase beta subunit n=1 Tax=Candidatus Nitrosoglobus terrae TaxID=1630141 RepID=A0A1Q2SK79_9GAMM|nr:glycine--tRNA ligase subunit beta [Candidatus Nitrosoglobus terrae]BAW79520.1 glycyl-tRNA synthetase subunit beta [Candidatus Nitrosoglobus terrae]